MLLKNSCLVFKLQNYIPFWLSKCLSTTIRAVLSNTKCNFLHTLFIYFFLFDVFLFEFICCMSHILHIKFSCFTVSHSFCLYYVALEDLSLELDSVTDI